MKVFFHLKGGQKGELLLNLIFPDYLESNDGEDGSEEKNSVKEKETDLSVSNSSGVFVYPCYGGDKGSRTPDLYDANVSLYHLSYIPTRNSVIYYTSSNSACQSVFDNFSKNYG